MANQTTVLISGAAGNLGGKLRKHLSGRYVLKLVDQNARGDGEIVQMDLSDSQVHSSNVFDGVDIVVHLAANPNEREDWAALVKTNIDATINTFLAASRAGVRRFVYASSNHVMGGYKDKSDFTKLTSDKPPLPGTAYATKDGTTSSTAYAGMKLFGERLGKCYAEATGMSVVAVRIGWVPPGENRPETIGPNVHPWLRQMWLSNQDFCQLMEKCMLAHLPKPFVILNGVSANKSMVWDIEEAHKLVAYRPMDGLR